VDLALPNPIRADFQAGERDGEVVVNIGP